MRMFLGFIISQEMQDVEYSLSNGSNIPIKCKILQKVHNK